MLGLVGNKGVVMEGSAGVGVTLLMVLVKEMVEAVEGLVVKGWLEWLS